ncbi:arsenite efflux transporter metallochaperone ArsD [Bacillus sp. ISL-47]|uniref:arsenite efflux transporter metallochaperone ArsD n=1 Tax=Bacillus sp. ISL-47 TaxID=2819130 RepID=UPI001BE8F352|nr:arsenite efflux transporter metallochaperone ArsD [Bacillus sp. ISL-47]MBT2690729.1 arsenite efflux transporter metallochaperone ArsD [Bacillus sp. ISL-47]MBT2709674.1 arsenite efflux transporter metallochaperone ArsD [Pseudomonas sp. ISL-84]
MAELEIFDPALCCATGVCGPSVDPKLARVASALFILEGKGFSIKRYNLGNEPDVYVNNPIVSKLLNEKGPDVLPLILLDGKAVKEGSYPTNEELASWFGVNASILEAKKSSNSLL